MDRNESPEVFRLPVDQIVVDPSLQPRIGGLDPDYIRALMERPEDWPPVSVVKVDGRLVLVDGFHRHAAAVALRIDELDVREAGIPDEGLAELAFVLNAGNGRALQLRDRRAFARRTLRNEPRTSNEAIAITSGLSTSTVRRLRAQLEADREIPETAYQPRFTDRVFVQRRPGELPETGLIQATADAVSDLLSSSHKKRQRQMARFLQRLAVAHRDLDTTIDDATDRDVVEACIATLGETKAEDLGEDLGIASRRLASIAKLLGDSTAHAA